MLSRFKFKYRTLLLLFFIIIVIEAGTYYLLNTKPQSSEKYSEELKLTCSKAYDWQDCYGKKLAEAARKRNTSFALESLSNLQKIDSRAQYCHLLAHFISQAVINKNPASWKEFLKEVNIVSCNYGYIHGTIETLSRVDQSFLITPKTIPQICQKIKSLKKEVTVDEACAHIMGHLILAQSPSKTIQEGIDQSVKKCSSLPSSLQLDCFGGVFMESYTRDNLTIHWNVKKINWRTEEFWQSQEKICNKYTGKAEVGCWMEMSHIYVSALDDPTLVYQACNHAPSYEPMINCYIRAVGSLIMKQNVDTHYYASICAPTENMVTGIFKSCLRGAIVPLILSSNSYMSTATKFCNAQKEKNQKKCFDQIKAGVSEIST